MAGLDVTTIAPGDRPAPTRVREWATSLGAHWAFVAVMAAFIASTFIVPTMAPVAISDDWVYIRSSEILLREGRFEILAVASSNLLFQVGWGTLFALVFGPALGVYRLSVVVLWFLSAFAIYGLLLQLTRSRTRSALGAAIYVFNPLGYSLAFTFMTDAPFVALLTIAVWAYARGLGRDREHLGWVFAGSLASACAVLIRQPGVFIPAGALLAVLIDGRAQLTSRGVRLVIAIAGAPFVTFVAFSLWLRLVHGEPAVMQLMQRQLVEGGPGAIGLQGLRLYTIELAYIGLFALPLAVGALVGFSTLARRMNAPAWAGFAAWQSLVLVSVAFYRGMGGRMPFAPHFVSSYGIGPNDLIAARPELLGYGVRDVLTVLCVAAAVAAGFLVIAALVRWHDYDPGDRRAIILVLSQVLVMFGGALVVSSHFRNWSYEGVASPTLDRYFLPLVPVLIAALLWALREVPFSMSLGWWVATFLAMFAVAGTRDNLEFHRQNWELAREANALGISNRILDAGASWDGYHLGEESLAEVGYRPKPGLLWWFSIYTPIIDPQYSIATKPVPRYTDVVLEKRYDLWLDTRPARLLLLRRDDVPGPP
ncbi:MAG: glycosyltransferase family 39 protein [Dehalococcoidia bacterium]